MLFYVVFLYDLSERMWRIWRLLEFRFLCEIFKQTVDKIPNLEAKERTDKFYREVIQHFVK